MAISQIEYFTKQFYDWEKWGRGWFLFNDPVDLEPPFVPFFFHKEPVEYVDDGKRHTIVSYLGELVKGKKTKVIPKVTEYVRRPFSFNDDSFLKAISVSIPLGQKVKVEEMEQLFLMLSMSELPCSFEILASQTIIRIQIVCRFIDTQYVKSQLKAYFPSIVSHERTELFFDFVEDDIQLFGFEYGLQEEFMRPLAMAKNFNIDPYTGLFGILENLKADEQILIQILFKGATNQWSESILRSVTDQQGGDFFLDAPEMVPLSKEKVSSPLFGCTIRIIGCSSNTSVARQIAERAGNGFMQISSSSSNKLIPLSIEGLDADQFFEDVFLRRSRRLGMLLNARELVTLAHFPSESITSSKLEREIKKTKSSPTITEGNKFVIGTNIHQGKIKEVTLSSSQRLKHTHVIGATGTGKSTFLLNLIIKDIELGNGVGVLEPHGDLIENIISRIPDERMQDVVIIDPADVEYPVGFNILTAHSDIEKEVLSSDLVAAFRRLSTSWGDQMNSVFANAILAFLENEKKGTLIDLRRFLIEKPFRDSYLKTVTDQNIVYYWHKEFPIVKSNSIGPILTRLDTFLRPRIIRNMVAQQKSIDFENILDTKKILLVKLSQGLIGAENSYLLGTFIVSKIHQAAMARQAKIHDERKDFFVYIDEFQNFITPSMSAILSGARKYHLGLILAHQDMQQLVKQDSELASSVVANAGTRVCFRVSDTDAKRFGDGFSYFESSDLQNLETGEAIVRVNRPEYDFNLRIEPLLELNLNDSSSKTNYVIAKSREKYGTKRSEIEALLNEIQAFEINESKISQTDPELVQQSRESIKEATVFQLSPVVQILPVTETQITETKSRLILQKEQSEHKYLQTFIKKMAEQRGFKASLEELTPDSLGRVDISLERNGFRIACEIAMTTTDDWEIHNIEKCLTAGYDTIATCSTNKALLEKIRLKIKNSISKKDHAKIIVVEPDELFQYLDSHIAKYASTETRMKGYRVKVEYSPTSSDEMKTKKDSITKVMLESLKEKTNK